MSEKKRKEAWVVKEIKKVHIVGMGALGLLFGTRIMDSLGEDRVTYVMDEERLEKYRGRIFTCNGKEYRLYMASPGQGGTADLVILAVKGPGMMKALDEMEGSVGENTILISVMNGISSEKEMEKRFGREKVVYTVAQGMDAMKFGDSLTYSHPGELRIGVLPGEPRENLESLKSFLDKAGISCTEEEDILHRLWGKFMLNVGINQVCMVYSTTYGGALAPGKTHDTMIAAMEEVIAVANAEGIHLTERDIQEYVEVLKTLRPEGIPSMGQDRINHKPSEVEMFAGTVIRLGKEQGIPVPVNEFLYQKIREIEKEEQNG